MIDDATLGAPLSLDTPEVEGTLSPMDTVAGADDPEAAAASEQTRRSTAEATAALPERERLAIELFYYEGRSLKEIAGILGVGESRVSQLCAQGIRRLRVSLGAETAP
jgi:RNA polymerase sigma factor FliA